MNNLENKTWGIVVDNDKKLEYENPTLLRKFFNLFFITFLNNLPRKSIHLIKRSHRSAEEIVDHKTSHKALEILYNFGHRKEKKNLKERVFHSIWFKTNNSKAARNRLKLTKREIKKYIEEKISKKENVNMLSIASGSARAIIETIAEIKNTEDRALISATFLDKNPEAILYSKNLASEITPFFKLNWLSDTVGNFFKKLNPEEAFDLIEVVGLMDYFSDPKVEEVYKNCYNNLKEGGILITANINKNSETPFVTRVIGWEMIYRKAEEVGELLEKSGFSKENISLYYEPLKIHTVAVAKKII